MTPDTTDRQAELGTPANLLRLLGHPARLSIALLLLSGPKTVSFIESHLELRQPNLSQHLALLRDTGLLTSSRKAKSVTYDIPHGLPRDILTAIADALQGRPAPAIPQTAPTATSPTQEVARIHGSRQDDANALLFATIRYPT